MVSRVKGLITGFTIGVYWVNHRMEPKKSRSDFRLIEVKPAPSLKPQTSDIGRTSSAKWDTLPSGQEVTKLIAIVAVVVGLPGASLPCSCTRASTRTICQEVSDQILLAKFLAEKAGTLHVTAYLK